ncbi:DHBP synthase RibB-like alpha/beta domain-containing protein [Dactylonectria estremocensis]|uniref:Threonylcarbamoyl-AMP synthase n=1 Tax=Dactylonectria estremocensis TaxID=1079267 RepID=A0A9P9JLE9_9HYPO|nr:DHBP synthase RibB-like alpha/beta domain-containing protein [Dactylonectria estremocensis]
MKTRVVKVPNKGPLGHFRPGEGLAKLDLWEVETGSSDALKLLEEAASELRTKDTPVAFPTETVYGLGADATRTGSVKGIYSAKGRPSDNPLIIHVSDLQMLRQYLGAGDRVNGDHDPIPSRYRSLIERFWPGPLTILMPNPEPSKLAPEVTAGLKTFGVRMPSLPLALSLIKLAGVPVAAPSANASTKPSPTTAQHVLDDLDGRIELILDGGHCDVGVESTVVDGLCDPPVILRPGGIGLDELRTCPGWENATTAYKDQSEEGKAAPRAPGMKYKHYSPKARVVLYESSYEKGVSGVVLSEIESANGTTNGTVTNGGRGTRRIGLIRTQRWKQGAGLRCDNLKLSSDDAQVDAGQDEVPYKVYEGELRNGEGQAIGQVLDIDLGKDTEGIARGLFSALREFDRRGADTILVDGIEDRIDIAAAVMNRLRKAASEIRA